jgi:SAM-dependent methyltransferase
VNRCNHFDKDIAYHAATAGEYDAVVVEPRALANQHLFGKFDSAIKEGSRMLDLGAGTGHGILRFGRRFEAVVGVDHSPDMLAVARRNLQRAGVVNAVLIRQDIFDFLESAIMSFDFVSAIGCLHHLPPETISDLVYRVSQRLVAGGMLLIADPIAVGAARPPHEIARWNAGSVVAQLAFSSNAEEADETPLDLNMLHAALQAAGLEQVHEERSWELFPHNLPATEEDRVRIADLFERYRNDGDVLCTLYRKL